MHKQDISSRYFIVFVALMTGLFGFLAGAVYNQSTNTGQPNQILTKADGTPIDASLLWEAWQDVSENYADQPVDQEKLLQGAIKGIVESFDDPHTMYFTKSENEEFLQELSGSFFGIGAEIAIKEKQLQVVAPLPDTPASRAGLRAGDYILKINDEDSYGMLIDEAVNKIRGEKGTTVKLSIYRSTEDAPRDIEIVRDEIKIQSVKYTVLDGNIGHLELRYFNGDTDSEFKKVAERIIKEKPKHVILDMRNNPGGFLDVAVTISSLFIEEGIIVSEKLADGTVTNHEATGRAILADIPLTVLINEGSASASEIVAGALKD